jgi:hypothetical protein
MTEYQAQARATREKTARLKALRDDELAALMYNLGGHDLPSLLEAFRNADNDRPTPILLSDCPFVLKSPACFLENLPVSGKKQGPWAQLGWRDRYRNGAPPSLGFRPSMLDG